MYPLDPLTATVGQGLLTSVAADLRDEGKTAEEAVQILLTYGLRAINGMQED